MSDADLHKLLVELCQLSEEKPYVEFKLNKGSISNEEIGEYISALSNGATISNKPFGFMVWGVVDKTHEIKGTNFKFSDLKQGNQNLELWLRNLISPKINFEISEFGYQDKRIVLISIPAAKGEPVNFQKKPFIRIGSHKTDLRNHPNYFRAIYNSLNDWSANIVDKATINDLDKGAIALARQKFKEKHVNDGFYRDIDTWDDATFLDKAKITNNGKITNTAIILVGKPESSYYLLPSISQVTWKLDTEEKAYEHFGPPLLINVSKVLQRIRNIKYKFFPDNELVATEVNKYEPRVILEALNNCIAHQDYSLNSRIIVTEKVDRLIFQNSGSFYEGTVDDYTLGTKTPEKYRNPWIAEAMVNLNMIDTMGYGIHMMFIEQRKRFFPLPDYTQSDSEHVVLEIYGHTIDINYSKILMEKQDLPLSTVVLLDRVQKRQPVTDDAIEFLRKQRLIEGRKPNLYVSAHIAEIIDEKAKYIKNRGFDNQYFKDLIIEYLKKYKSASRNDVDNLLFDKLSNILEQEQKQNKIKNILQEMSKIDMTIKNEGSRKQPRWTLNS